MILACKELKKAYGIDCILEKISFHIEERDKVGIVGVNGAGKSTLFKILTGEISYDGGELYLKKSAAIGYLAQNVAVDGNHTIYQEMIKVFQPIIDMEEQLRNMELQMSGLSGKEMESLMGQYARLQQEFEKKDGYGYKSRIRGVLKGLGFSEDEYDKPVCQLSGGQKTRVYLGRLLLTKPDLLQLDEPTNHLDIESIQWLEDFLRAYTGAVIVISHDRYFMDRVVTKIVEIENKKSMVYEGNYSFYAKQKDINRAIAQKQYEDQQKEIKRQEEVIRTLKAFNREKSVKRAESREKALEKIEKIERPENLPEKMRLTLTPKLLSGKDVIHGENLSKSFNGRRIFSNVNFDVKREEKVAIIGPNGVGKSTLFKMIMQEIATDTGKIQLGANVQIGYYDQEQQKLTDSNTIFEEIAQAYPNLTNGQIRNVLAAFVFTGDDIFKTIASLSGGEKGRVALAKIMLSEANLLMLDEPTNHLDMYSKEILEDAINNYEGTVVYISHDRYFIEKTADKVLELSPEGLQIYYGNYSYYLEKKTRKAQEEEEVAVNSEKAIQKEEMVSESKADWLKQKEEQARLRKISNQIEKTEKEIEQTEQQIEDMDKMLFDEEISRDSQKSAEIYEKKMKLEERLTELYDIWENLQLKE